MQAEATNRFKTKLDKFCRNQELFYDYCVEIQKKTEAEL